MKDPLETFAVHPLMSSYQQSKIVKCSGKILLSSSPVFWFSTCQNSSSMLMLFRYTSHTKCRQSWRKRVKL